MQWDTVTKVQKRYSFEDLNKRIAQGMPVNFQPQYEGKQNQIKSEEHKKISLYKSKHGNLRPPGNKIDR